MVLNITFNMPRFKYQRPKNYLRPMKGKLLLVLSLVLFAAFGFWIMKTLFLNNSELLNIPESGLSFELPERTFKMIESEGEPIRISLGQVSRKAAVIEILLGENNLKKEEIREGEEIQFTYEQSVYALKLENIKAKLVGEEVASFRLSKKGSTKQVQVEKSVSEFIHMISEEDFEVLKKKRTFSKRRFLKKLKYKSRKLITIDELIEKAEQDFSKVTIKQNGKVYPVAVWLSLKK